MYKRRKLVLHVGFNKTGSSALQSWFANSKAELGKLGIKYHDTGGDSISYQVSSGNGWMLQRYLDGEVDAENAYEYYFNNNYSYILISSEILRLTKDRTGKLKSFVDDFNIDVNIIAFIRDAYSFCYSGTVQQIKRDNGVKKIGHTLKNVNEVRHIVFGNSLLDYFDNVRFVNYNHCKKDVAKAFCEAASFDYERLPKMSKIVVNRTITSKEIEVVIVFSKIENSSDLLLEGHEDKVSKLITDWLVNNFRDRTEPRYAFRKDIEAFESRLAPSVEAFNARAADRLDYPVTIKEGDLLLVDETKVEKLDIDLLRQVSKHLSDNLSPRRMALFRTGLEHYDLVSSNYFKESYKAKLKNFVFTKKVAIKKFLKGR